jgi:plastocyanin
MSIWGKHVPLKRLALVVSILVVSALASVMTRPRPREITLVARGMAFYVEGNSTPNPTIDARPGETLRIVVRNHDRGMTHDFAVPAADAAVDLLEWNDEDAVTFEVPATPGTYEYVCRPHLVMMKGKLIVRDE